MNFLVIMPRINISYDMKGNAVLNMNIKIAGEKLLNKNIFRGLCFMYLMNMCDGYFKKTKNIAAKKILFKI